MEVEFSFKKNKKFEPINFKHTKVNSIAQSESRQLYIQVFHVNTPL